jgi:hypothetical protein
LKESLVTAAEDLTSRIAEKRKEYANQHNRKRDTAYYLKGMKRDLEDVVQFIQEPAMLSVSFLMLIWDRKLFKE